MSQYQISLEAYKVFCAVVDRKNISKAAEDLYVTQPSVSMTIKMLEKKLGCILFVRLPKGVKLTSEGKELYNYLTQAMSLINVAEKKISEINQLKSGEINIAASDSIISGLLLTYLEKYKESYSGICVKVVNRTTQETIELLKNGAIDIGFINLPIKVDDDIEVLKSIPVKDSLIFGTAYKEICNEDFEMKKLMDYPVLMLKESSHTRKLLDKYTKKLGIDIVPALELDSTELLIKFAAINFGVAFAIEDFLKKEIDNKKLFSKPLIPSIPNRGIAMIKHKRIPLSHAASKFARLVVGGE